MTRHSVTLLPLVYRAAQGKGIMFEGSFGSFACSRSSFASSLAQVMAKQPIISL